MNIILLYWLGCCQGNESGMVDFKGADLGYLGFSKVWYCDLWAGWTPL